MTPQNQRITLAAHRPPRGEGIKRSDPHPEEQAHRAKPHRKLPPYVAALKQKGRKVVALALRQLLRLLREYPREPFLAAVREASRYGLYDLDRLERMILRRVARDYFLLGKRSRMAMTEELEQLLKNLKLKRMLSVYDEQLRAAEKAKTFLTRSSSPDCCARNGTTGRRALWSGGSAGRICRNAGRWKRFRGRTSRA